MVIDAALGLQELGHFVTIYTSHFDPKHAFSEVADGTIRVKVFGNSLVPRNVMGRFSIICAMMRQIHLFFQLKALGEADAFDVFIVDQLSICVPFFREYLPNARIVFYGHFPDKLLADHSSALTNIYRYPFDVLEQWSTALADVIVVNSKFTRSVYKDAFPKITVVPEVLYPCVNTKNAADNLDLVGPFKKNSYVLSINRFEPKKNIALALNSFAAVFKSLSEQQAASCKLILSGGYDQRLAWNVSYLIELQNLAKSHGLSHVTVWPADGESALSTPDVQRATVVFMPSISDAIKQKLVVNAALLAYTPIDEHFGIVPLEAMLVGTPVLATNTGGPLETIIPGKTGWTLAPKVELWADTMKSVLFDMTPAERATMATYSKDRVLSVFSETHMAREFEKYSQIAASTVRMPGKHSFKLFETFGAIFSVGFALLVFLYLQLNWR